MYIRVKCGWLLYLNMELRRLKFKFSQLCSKSRCIHRVHLRDVSDTVYKRNCFAESVVRVVYYIKLIARLRSLTLVR